MNFGDVTARPCLVWKSRAATSRANSAEELGRERRKTLAGVEEHARVDSLATYLRYS